MQYLVICGILSKDNCVAFCNAFPKTESSPVREENTLPTHHNQLSLWNKSCWDCFISIAFANLAIEAKADKTNKANKANEADKADKADAIDEASKAEANEANEAKANEAIFADEAFNAKADEVDEPTSRQNKAKANEADVAIMPAKANVAEVHTADKTINEADAKADEADAKANEADTKANTTNKLDEFAVAKGWAEGHVVVEGWAKGYVVASCSQCVVWSRCIQCSLGWYGQCQWEQRW